MATSTLIHNTSLFYPYSRTYYEADGYYSIIEADKPSVDFCDSPSSASSSPSSPSTSPLQSISSISSSDHCDNVDWNRVMSGIKKTMYNSTSAIVPSPITYLGDSITFKPKPSKDPAFFYNSDILDVKDMYSYRQLRSENLLYRMFNCPFYKVDVSQTSVVRLTKGVFIANKLQPAISSPKMNPLDLLDASFLDGDASVDTIDTFHSGNMKQFMLQHQQQPAINHHQQFVPFSYTFGARYTNPYHCRDIVIRAGQLPLWCQTLFLNECVNRMPLQPNVPYTGLFPFAPSFIVVFRSMTTSPLSNNNQDYLPDLAFTYERYAMELYEPTYMLDNDSSGMDQKRQVMNQMLFCDIVEGAAEVLTQLANLWASDQSLFF